MTVSSVLLRDVTMIRRRITTPVLQSPIWFLVPSQLDYCNTTLVGIQSHLQFVDKLGCLTNVPRVKVWPHRSGWSTVLTEVLRTIDYKLTITVYAYSHTRVIYVADELLYPLSSPTVFVQLRDLACIGCTTLFTICDKATGGATGGPGGYIWGRTSYLHDHFGTYGCTSTQNGHYMYRFTTCRYPVQCKCRRQLTTYTLRWKHK